MRKATYALLLAGRARWPAGATMLLVVVLVSQGSGGPGAAAQEPAGNPLRNAYFGELHVHTNWSLDAYRNGNFEDPAVAYRFGRGEAVAGPDGGARVRRYRCPWTSWRSPTTTSGWARSSSATTSMDRRTTRGPAATSGRSACPVPAGTRSHRGPSGAR